VTIQQMVAAQDSYGSPTDQWEDVATVWASVEPLKGRELIAAQAVQAEIAGRIRLRYRPDVTTAHRVVFGNLIFNILSVINPAYRNRELELMTSEGVNNG
jgi:SPP1 family predicted phage head-tail adaptor